MVTKGNILKPG